MLKVYGSILCPDCVRCREDLECGGVDYEYLDFSDSLGNLKDFLRIRDGSDVFADAKREGYIGIPCIVDENGAVTLDWSVYVSQDNA